MEGRLRQALSIREGWRLRMEQGGKPGAETTGPARLSPGSWTSFRTQLFPAAVGFVRGEVEDQNTHAEAFPEHLPCARTWQSTGLTSAAGTEPAW